MYFGMTIFLQLSRAALLFIRFMYAISKPYHHSNRFRKYDKLMYFYIFFVSLICNDLIILFLLLILFVYIFILHNYLRGVGYMMICWFYTLILTANNFISKAAWPLI